MPKENEPTMYPPECVINLETGCELRCPAHPDPCEYVRIVDPMVGEVAYWDSAEWAEDPMGVMGAIIGAMSSESEDAEGEGNPTVDPKYTQWEHNPRTVLGSCKGSR
jgi:hypothetical protein